MSSTKRPLPPQPDIKLYEHLNEKERMIAGFPYKPSDPQLKAERLEARQLIRKYNALDPAATAERKGILAELIPVSKDRKIFIESPFQVDYGYNLNIGNNLEANFGCVFLDCAPITIGKNCLMAPNVHLYAATHPIDPKYRQDNADYHELAYPIKIGDNCWIGGQAIICPGVTIGNNVTVGAGSVVTKDVPDNVVVAGNPARIIREL